MWRYIYDSSLDYVNVFIINGRFVLVNLYTQIDLAWGKTPSPYNLLKGSVLMYLTTPKNYAIFILGAGGTGSWLCAFLDKMSLNNNVIVMDGDIVESKNVLRQNFKRYDVDKKKAEVVANSNMMSYVHGYITDTSIFHQIMSEFPEGTVPMLIGCLDNNASRKIAHDFVQEVPNIVWIDGGNAERHGQAYVCIKENGEIVEGYESPIDIEPAFQNYEGDERRPDQISCAEHSESAPQNVTANVTSANVIFNLMAIFLNGGAITANKYIFDTRSVTMTPVR